MRARKAELGLLGQTVCIPQSYDWGVEGQVDWYEAMVELAGERQLAQVFVVRSMASRLAYHRAYPRATQQAFLDAHQRAFHYFGGVFRRLRYDNLTSAVKKIPAFRIKLSPSSSPKEPHVREAQVPVNRVVDGPA